MGDIILSEESVPTTPSSGFGNMFFDTTASLWAFKDDGGTVHARSTNASIASDATGFAADTWVTGSDLLIPSWGLQAKTIITWRISASKTGAGVATPIYTIRTGTARTTGDTSRLALTGPAQTAVADVGTLTIMAVVRNIGASGVIQATAWWEHRGTAANTTTSGTGFANDSTGHVEATSAGFDNTAASIAGKYISLSINGGTSAAFTVTQVQSEVDW